MVDVALATVDVFDPNIRKDLGPGKEDRPPQDVAHGIQERGLVEPPVLAATAGRRDQVMAGQRRALVCRLLGLEATPARAVVGHGERSG